MENTPTLVLLQVTLIGKQIEVSAVLLMTSVMLADSSQLKLNSHF